MYNFQRYPHTDLNQQNQDWLISEMNGLISEYKNFRNPEVIHSADEMTNENKIYVYIGNESGYLSNYWYYYDNDTNEWTVGGKWGENEITLDTTLTSTTEPAQGKAVGDAIAIVNNNVNTVSTNLTQLNAKIPNLITRIDTSNTTDFVFSDLPNLTNTAIFKYALMFGGWGPTGILYQIFIGTDNSVTFTPIIAATSTFTGTVDNVNNTLTISCNTTVYGGLRLIWIN